MKHDDRALKLADEVIGVRTFDRIHGCSDFLLCGPLIAHLRSSEGQSIAVAPQPIRLTSASAPVGASHPHFCLRAQPSLAPMFFFGVENHFNGAGDRDRHAQQGSCRLRFPSQGCCGPQLACQRGCQLRPLRKTLLRDRFLNDKRVIMLVLDA
jgi:hypothetical protein